MMTIQPRHRVSLRNLAPWVRSVRRRVVTDGVMTVFVELDGRLAGALVLSDPLRPDASRTLRELRRNGFRRLVMASGDRALVAEADADRASELTEQVLWRLTLLPARMTHRTLTRELLLLERGRYFAGVQVDAEATVQAKGILKSLSGLVDDQTRDDTKRLIKNAADLAENLNRQNQRLTDVLENLRGVTADLKKTMASLAERSDSISAHIDKTLGTVEERVQSLTERADATMARIGDLAGHADQLLVDNRADLTVMIRKFRDISLRVADITAEIQSGHGVLGQLIVNRDLAKDVNSIAVDLAVAADLVNDHPRALIFGLSDSQRDENRARRDRLKMRRAFQEGFGTKDPAAAAPAPAAEMGLAPAGPVTPAPVP